MQLERMLQQWKKTCQKGHPQPLRQRLWQHLYRRRRNFHAWSEGLQIDHHLVQLSYLGMWKDASELRQLVPS